MNSGVLAVGVVVRGGTQRLGELRYEIWYDLVPVFLFIKVQWYTNQSRYLVDYLYNDTIVFDYLFLNIPPNNHFVSFHAVEKQLFVYHLLS
jgi:hypothetical protein